jgi:hypothetical protein
MSRGTDPGDHQILPTPPPQVSLMLPILILAAIAMLIGPILLSIADPRPR